MSEKPSAVLDPSQATFLEIVLTVFLFLLFPGQLRYWVYNSKKQTTSSTTKNPTIFFSIYKNKKHKKVFWFIKVKLSYITALSTEHCAEQWVRFLSFSPHGEKSLLWKISLKGLQALSSSKLYCKLCIFNSWKEETYRNVYFTGSYPYFQNLVSPKSLKLCHKSCVVRSYLINLSQ